MAEPGAEVTRAPWGCETAGPRVWRAWEPHVSKSPADCLWGLP